MNDYQAMAARIGQAVLGAAWGLIPLALAAAWLATLTVSRLVAYSRWRVFPKPLRTELNLVTSGMKADYERLERLSHLHASVLGSVVLAVLQTSGRPLAEHSRLADEAITLEMAQLRRANGWFDVLYATSTLIGLLGAIVGLVDAFARSAALAGEGKAALNAAIASALVTTGLGVVIAIAARITGEWFHHRHQNVAIEVARQVKPLLLDLEEPQLAIEAMPVVPVNRVVALPR